jgi:hypothetical protein
MNTKIIMTSSAIILGIAGILLIFLPDEIAALIVRSSDLYLRLLFQILGALYFGFAMLNWMARDSAIGGIYNRPVTVANLSHFAIGALALIKEIMADHQPSLLFLVMTLLYMAFAVSFGALLFTHPGAPADREKKD